VTIHPFDDGNGRVTRALTDLVLALAEPSPTRLWSLSAQIEQEREAYYTALQSAQRGTGDVTEWLRWFLGCAARALGVAEAAIDRVLAKVRFWARHAGHACNARQVKILDRLLQAGPGGFEGGMTTRKAAALTGASRATAQRDLAELVAAGLLRPLPGGGRSSAYEVAWG
jgi:Fic family protein